MIWGRKDKKELEMQSVQKIWKEGNSLHKGRPVQEPKNIREGLREG